MRGTIYTPKNVGLFGQGDVNLAAALASYSADRIGEAGCIRRPFEMDGSLWVCIGMSAGGQGSAGRYRSIRIYRLTPAAKFVDAATTYREKTMDCEAARNDPNGFYHGITVKSGGQTFVLTGPEYELLAEPTAIAEPSTRDADDEDYEDDELDDDDLEDAADLEDDDDEDEDEDAAAAQLGYCPDEDEMQAERDALTDEERAELDKLPRPGSDDEDDDEDDEDAALVCGCGEHLALRDNYYETDCGRFCDGCYSDHARGCAKCAHEAGFIFDDEPEPEPNFTPAPPSAPAMQLSMF